MLLSHFNLNALVDLLNIYRKAGLLWLIQTADKPAFKGGGERSEGGEEGGVNKEGGGEGEGGGG